MGYKAWEYTYLISLFLPKQGEELNSKFAWLENNVEDTKGVNANYYKLLLLWEIFVFLS